jgi:hypothetical protein
MPPVVADHVTLTCPVANKLLFVCSFNTVMAGMAPEGSQFDAKHYDSKMSELL